MASITDDFNRADGALGANWAQNTNVGGSLAIASNQVGGVSSSQEGMSHYIGTSFGGDHYAECVVSNPTSGNGGGPAVRLQNTTLYQGYAVYWDSNGVLYLAELGQPDLDSAIMSMVGGETVRLEASGSNIRVLVNSVEVCSGVDATLSGGSPGLYIYNTGAFRVDNFAAGDLSSGVIRNFGVIIN